MKYSLREKLYNKVGGEGSFLNTEVTPRGLASIIGAGIIATSTGCATTGNYGKLNSSDEVTKNFEGYEVKPNHNYFRTGTDKNSPNAILALDNNYTLDNSSSWHSLGTLDNLEKLVKNMKSKASESLDSVNGADVLNPDEKDVGDWYSTTKRTVIKQKDATTFIIYTPSAISGPDGGDGDSGGGGCFLGGTKILMADGTSKNIRNIREGEKVMSY
ncbi:MAG: hypothetical protein KAH05_07790, partial [Clostridiales bacterium]|nr:hypothetical protein [Clostridiales bacterium]